MRVRPTLAPLAVALFILALMVTPGCAPTGGNGDNNNNQTPEPLSLTASRSVSGGGNGGSSTGTATQETLGDAGANNCSVAFRALLRPAADASARRFGQIRIARSGFSYDEGSGSAGAEEETGEDVIPGAEVRVVGVNDVSGVEDNGDDVFEVPTEDFSNADIAATTDECIDEGSQDALANGDLDVVCDQDGDCYLPPLPPLDDFESNGEDLAYIVEIAPPNGVDLEPTRAAFRPRAGQIVLVGDQVDPPLPTDTYNITDYFPATPGRHYVYQEHVTRRPWSLWTHELLPNPAAGDEDVWSQILPDVPPFSSFPFELWEGVEYYVDNASKWQWWAPGPDGLALYADAPLNAPGETVPIAFWVPPLVFPNGLEVGVEGTQELQAIWNAQAQIEQAGDQQETTLQARYQIQAAGEEVETLAGVFDDTLTVVWSVPYAEPSPDGNSIAYSPTYNQVTVWTLARGVGIITAEVWHADPNDPRLRELQYYAELTSYEDDFWPGDEAPPTEGLTVNFASPEGTMTILSEVYLLFSTEDAIEGDLAGSQTIDYTSTASAVFPGVSQQAVRVKAWAMDAAGGTIARGEQTYDLASVGSVVDLTLESLQEAQLTTITLDWNDLVSDLDAHILGPNALDNDIYHVCWFKMGAMDAEPFVNLDRDDVDYYGPEINTFTQLVDGQYQYGVHNYAEWAGYGEAALPDSAAHVVLALPTGDTHEYFAPTLDAGSGDLWHVFNLNVSAGGTVVDVEDVSQYMDLYDWWSPGLTRSAMPRKR